MVDYSRVFGCVAHVHIPDQNRSKLDDKSKRCVLLGVSDESKAWRLYDPISKKIIVSKDVVFEEEKGWDWGRSVEEIKRDILECEDEGDTMEDQNEELGETSPNNLSGSPGNFSSSSISNSSSNKSSSLTISPPNEPNSDDNDLVEGRGMRVRREPIWMTDYETEEGLSDDENLNAMMMVTDNDPTTFEEAVKCKNWREAMSTEIESIERNQTWELTVIPKDIKPIGVKWVFKTKLNEDGTVEKFKARLVAKGYAQCHGIDYTEVFAPVARLNTIRVILAIAAQFSWEVFQLDVKSDFLHGELKEEVYVEQPAGFVKKGEEEKVYKLKKELYGLKQAPRAWYSRIEAYFIREEFERCSSEHTLFKKSKGGKLLIVSLYVDDLIFTGNDKSMCDEFKNSMMSEFDMSDLGKMKHFLGVEVKQCAGGIFICQRRYAKEVLARFGMEDSSAVKNPIVPGTKLRKDEGGVAVDETLYKQVVGSLMYLTVTRPDMMFGVSLISRFMARPTMAHWLAAKRILRYLKGTINLGIFYRKQEFNLKLVAFILIVIMPVT